MRVLVVDDSRPIRLLLTQALEAHGYAPVQAETAEDALAIALSDPPDAIVVDHHLPGLSGVDFVRIVRGSSNARLRSVPVVGLSGVNGSERALLDAGASCFIPKPIHEPALIKAVSNDRNF
jgi:CheY-like chemotaxis protein